MFARWEQQKIGVINGKNGLQLNIAGTPCSVHFLLPPRGASLGTLSTGPVASPNMPPFCPSVPASVPLRVPSCFKDVYILCFRLKANKIIIVTFALSPNIFEIVETWDTTGSVKFRTERLCRGRGSAAKLDTPYIERAFQESSSKIETGLQITHISI
jgi:hypothetical protein